MDARRHFQTIDEYINTFPKEVQAILEKLRQTIQKAAPQATQAISYGIPIELIRIIVKYRVKESEKRKKGKK
jgi:uncharacterized protein YdhG (YjbR/CyaY superfamily)